MLEYWAVLNRDGWVEPATPGTIPGEIDNERRLEVAPKLPPSWRIRCTASTERSSEFILFA
jgi:hypothetical protein